MLSSSIGELVTKESIRNLYGTLYPKKYAHGFCFAVLCSGYTLTDFSISIRLTSLALWQSNDCPSASKATLMNVDKYFMWIHYERLHNQNKAKHNKTVCIFLGIYCSIGELVTKEPIRNLYGITVDLGCLVGSLISPFAQKIICSKDECKIEPSKQDYINHLIW